MTLPKKSYLVITAALVVISYMAGSSGTSDAPQSTDASGATEAVSAKPEIWTCSMHPQVRLPEAGKCPICFMDLIPASSGDDEDLGPRTLRMSDTAMALAEIETAKVERRTVAHEVNMVGKIAFDETRVAYITSWVSGRLDRLFVDYKGVTVREGDHLVEIYSPTLYSAQQELLQAIATAKRLEGSALDIVKTTSDLTVISSREKLRLYGLSEGQIEKIVESGVPSEHITIEAPLGGIVVHKNALEGMYVKEGTQIYTIADLSKVWVQLDAYESDLGWIRYGQEVEFTVEAYPGETFVGRVAFIDPTLDDHTRTVKVRLNVDNSDQRLKPEMFVSATAQAVLTAHGKVVDEDLVDKWMCPMHPEVIADGPEACPECGMDLVPATDLGFTRSPEQALSLVIPSTSALVTGKRAVVYIRLPDQEKPTFEGRVIALGPRAGDWYVVYDGVEEGEDIVVKGNFKIDSELQIRAKPSMMSGDDEPAPATPAEPVPVATPVEFREQLGVALTAYLELQASLAGDEDNASAAESLTAALGKVDMGLLEGDAHMSWMEAQESLLKSAADLSAATDLEQRRTLLSSLTDEFVPVLKTFGYEGTADSAGVFHCPMALDGEGADWIQMGEQTSNPYYGSAMLRCGDLEEVLKLGSLMGSAELSPVSTPLKFREQLGAVVDAYLAVQASFANDKDNAAKAQDIVSALGAVNMGLLEGDGHMQWMGLLPGLTEAAKQMAAAADLESRRVLLSPLTEQLTVALKAFGYEHEQVGVFHCPMALDGEGANWIQMGDDTLNPYYGSSMLGCGDRSELLNKEN